MGQKGFCYMSKITLTKAELQQYIADGIAAAMVGLSQSEEPAPAKEAIEKAGAKVKTTKTGKSFLIILGYEDKATWTAAMNKARRQGYNAAKAKGGDYPSRNAAGIKAAAKVAGAKVKTVKAANFKAAVAKATR